MQGLNLKRMRISASTGVLQSSTPALSLKLIIGFIMFSIALIIATLVICVLSLMKMSKFADAIEMREAALAREDNNTLNIPAPEEITPSNNNEEKYKVYADYVTRLNHSLDLTKDPCNNFYEYTCNNYQQSGVFEETARENGRLFFKQIQDDSYMGQPNLPKPVKQAGLFFQNCVDTKNKWAKGQGKREWFEWIEAKMAKLEKILNVSFPLIHHEQKNLPFPDPDTLSSALAHLGMEEDVQTFITIVIGTNWGAPHSDQPYILFFDQAKTSNSDLGDMENTLLAYAKMRGANVDKRRLKEDVEAMFLMESGITIKMNKAQREFKDLYNVYDIETANRITDHLKFDVMVEKMFPHQKKNRLNKIVLTAPSALNRTMEFLHDKSKVKTRTIYNYLFYRLLNKCNYFVPLQQTTVASKLRRRQLSRTLKFPSGIHGEQIDFGEIFEGEEKIFGECADEMVPLFPLASDRIFLDAKLPRQEERQKLRQDVGTMIASIADSFRGMLTQVDWMTAASKIEAYKKVDNLIQNVGWLEIIENDQEFTEFFADLDIKPEMSFIEMRDNLFQFKREFEKKRFLTANDTDRADFLRPAIEVNAFYNPVLNSITLPLGILNSPFYNSDYPASIKFGGMGVVTGHEISHGFDNQGIQWDATGVLKDWMDKKSDEGFQQMAKCVIDEYDQFETVGGHRIDGKQTLGENIADNGGLRAAFRAYRTEIGLNGPDPRLPDERFKQFSHDQLFFLSFAHVWCAPPPSEALMSSDPHSPRKFRIFGSLQNFPAFRDAFNCPLGSKYGPEEHCQVWETESNPTE